MRWVGTRWDEMGWDVEGVCMYVCMYLFLTNSIQLTNLTQSNSISTREVGGRGR